MKALITGATGFVGQHLASYLVDEGLQVYGTSRNNAGEINNVPEMKVMFLDFNDVTAIVDLLNKVRPDFVYHLAGQSSVKDSWTDKVGTFHGNIRLTMNLMEAILQSEIRDSVRVLTVGSSEEYGGFDSKGVPIAEETILKPTSPYGISKATVSMLARHYYSAYQIKVTHTRPFNHIGPGQRLGFVVSDFSNQIVQIEKGNQNGVISVGNLSAKRDFTDVRDIVRAYSLLLNQQNDLAWGESINVCSGKAISIQCILDTLLSLTEASIEVVVDQNKLRPLDIPVFTGDNTKLKSLTGWTQTIKLNETLRDVLISIRNET
ncbi:GDP-mannose 4,6-dehydratase ['Paenibacillus yunnanensis' Narsing Rao et al. 2020]|uniref:GDP-mannose 4,6-dehydratase n=1 Tax=Paenibacillus tengchongensis TaxID=2608684 RepID=UPI00124EC36C|nr:GDP-mannose 4,6-dehydratase [Paenibacillus tengchongensis]